MFEKDFNILNKEELFKINEYYGYKFNKRCSKKILIKNLLIIYRINNIVNNINLNSHNEECPICFIELNKFNYIYTDCGHFFCIRCIHNYITTQKEICPLCRNKYTYDNFINTINIINNKNINYKKNNQILNFQFLYKLFIVFLKIILFYISIIFLYKLLVC